MSKKTMPNESFFINEIAEKMDEFLLHPEHSKTIFKKNDEIFEVFCMGTIKGEIKTIKGKIASIDLFDENPKTYSKKIEENIKKLIGLKFEN